MRKGVPVKVRKGQWLLIIVITLILSCIMTAGIQLIISFNSPQTATEKQAQVSPKELADPFESAIPISSQPDQGEQSVLVESKLPEDRQSKENEALVVGTVSIINPDGFVVNEFPAAVVNGSWLALPTRACVGGDKWYFKVGNEKSIPIEGGLWGRGDTVGFWQLEGGRKIPGPGFATWEQVEEVRLFSFRTGELSKPTVLTPSGMEGVFIYSTLPSPQDPGVYIQNGRVVGWSFGGILEGAYMWVLGSRKDLLYENYVDDFYHETFAGGREEYFATILAGRRTLSPQRQLQMFAEGFRRPPKLLPEDTPSYLRAENVYPVVSQLVNQIMNQGGDNYIALLGEEPLLWEAGDPELLKNVILATQKVFGTEAALNFIEGSGQEMLGVMEGKNNQVLQFHLELYLGLIRNNLDNGEIVKGWQNYNRARTRFNESTELHLLGVELALAEGDWEAAEILLYQKEYPPELRDRISLLGRRISDLKGYENKIVIRFPPGSGEIPVKTKVNDKSSHDFLIDTGATYVTIPYSTVESLGLENEMSPHQQEVQTAGGPVFAKAVTLSSIELQGWVVSDVIALVIDIPNRPGLGLLGLDFLNRFNMDLKADEGVLSLEPK